MTSVSHSQVESLTLIIHLSMEFYNLNFVLSFQVSTLIMAWHGMEVFLYTEGIQLTAAHSGGRYSDLTQIIKS